MDFLVKKACPRQRGQAFVLGLFASLILLDIDRAGGNNGGNGMFVHHLGHCVLLYGAHGVAVTQKLVELLIRVQLPMGTHDIFLNLFNCK